MVIPKKSRPCCYETERALQFESIYRDLLTSVRETHSSAKHQKLNFRKRGSKQIWGYLPLSLLSQDPEEEHRNPLLPCQKHTFFSAIRCFIVEHLRNAKQHVPLACLLDVPEMTIFNHTALRRGWEGSHVHAIATALSPQSSGCCKLAFHCRGNPKVNIKREAQLWKKSHFSLNIQVA